VWHFCNSALYSISILYINTLYSILNTRYSEVECGDSGDSIAEHGEFINSSVDAIIAPWTILLPIVPTLPCSALRTLDIDQAIQLHGGIPQEEGENAFGKICKVPRSFISVKQTLENSTVALLHYVVFATCVVLATYMCRFCNIFFLTYCGGGCILWLWG